MVRLPRCTLADWTPDAGDVEAWLEQWAAAGWVPEHAWSGGVECDVRGRTVVGWAMIDAEQEGGD